MILFVLLALDLAGYAHRDLSADGAAIVALVLAIVALAFTVRGGNIAP